MGNQQIDPSYRSDAKKSLDSLLQMFDDYGFEPEAASEFKRLVLMAHGPAFFATLFGPQPISQDIVNGFRVDHGLGELDSYEAQIISRHNAASSDYWNKRHGARPAGLGLRR